MTLRLVKPKLLISMVRPERFELPTLWFEAKCSIQLSYGRVKTGNYSILKIPEKLLSGN